MSTQTMKMIHNIAMVLVIIGAINWGFSAMRADKGGKNLVHSLVGTKGTVDTPAAYNKTEKLIYTLVGLAGLFLAVQACMKQKSESDYFF